MPMNEEYLQKRDPFGLNGQGLQHPTSDAMSELAPVMSMLYGENSPFSVFLSYLFPTTTSQEANTFLNTNKPLPQRRSIPETYGEGAMPSRLSELLRGTGGR